MEVSQLFSTPSVTAVKNQMHPSALHSAKDTYAKFNRYSIEALQ
jgi:hypothetical protein